MINTIVEIQFAATNQDDCYFTPFLTKFPSWQDTVYLKKIIHITELGSFKFISHSLLYNPETSAEYIQDDCLRLRVVSVAVYSTPFLTKFPSWQDPNTAATQSVCDFTLTEFTKRKQFNNEYYSQHHSTHNKDHMGTSYASKCIPMVMVRMNWSRRLH